MLRPHKRNLQYRQIPYNKIQLRTMASHVAEQQMVLVPGKGGLMSFPGITADTSRTVSELLQKNENDYHGFFSNLGFHNHMVDDLLASYDFGATSANLHSIYNRVKEVQRLRPQVDSKALTDLSDENAWHKYLGNIDHYSDFLVFFQKEMAEIGWQQMINKRLFAGTEAANNLLVRSFGGLSHAIIRIGYGLEFGLLGLISQGLALAASSNDWPADFLLSSDREATVMEGYSGKSLRALIDEIRNDQKIQESGDVKIPLLYKPLLAGAAREMISYAKQYRVPVDLIQQKTAESANISAFMLGGAIRKNKEVKVDFFLLHCVTSSIFLTTFIAQDWIAPEGKVRLLEWKGRFDLLSYASVGVPALHKDEIENYIPKVAQDGAGNPWLSIIERGMRTGDDGHTIKIVRALVNGGRFCAKYCDVAGMDFPVVGDMWMKIAAMSVDSAEGCGDCLGGSLAWVRGAGFDEAWECFGPRKTHL